MYKRIAALLLFFLTFVSMVSAQKSIFDFKNELLYEAQILLDSDFVAGVKILNAEARRNNPLAIYYLASTYANGFSPHCDLKKAEQLLLKLSDKGYPEVYSLLGAIYNSSSRPYSLNRDDLAFQWYTKAVESGNVWDKSILAEFYLEGRGVEPDYEKAFLYALTNANQYNKISSYVLGQCYLNGYGTPRNDLDAAVWFRRAAEMGYSKAQTQLGYCYENGLGVVPNMVEACNWYRKAADQGEKIAQNNLGNYYTYGIGVDIDYPEGMRYYKLSAEQGFSVALYNIGICYYNALGVDNDDTEAVKWFRLSAEQAYDLAQNALGNCYRYGRGVEQDYKEAFRFYQLAKKNSNPYVLVNLADMYRFGLGVPQQLDSAASYYMYSADNGNWAARDSLLHLPLSTDSLSSLKMAHAAELFNKGYYQVSSQYFLSFALENNASAQYIVGMFYLDGNYGLDADTIQALNWINKAVDQGYDVAQVALANLYIEGAIVPKDFDRALKLLEQSATQGNAAAMNNLGWMYEKGNGVSRNDQKALHYYQEAAKKNFSTAFFHLGQFYEQGRIVTMDKELAQHYYELADSAGEVRASDALTKLLSPNMPHRYALLVANDDYRVRLDNPINDERDFEKKLKGLGFQIMRCLNRDYKSMKDSIAKFCDQADGYDVALFYYAGHALQDRGINYLIPAQPTRPSNEADYINVYVDLPFVINSMKNRSFNRRIVILDACRDLPDYISVSSRGAESQGLAAITEIKDFLIAYSTQAGETAQDGPRGGNSPYMKALLEELDVPQQDLDNIFIHIRERVDELTDSKQVPFYVNGLRESRNDKFIFNSKNNKQHAKQIK